MKVSIELSPEYSEPYAIIYADKITDNIQRTLDIFSSNESPITAFKNENDIVILQPKEIYMVRVENKDTIIYGKEHRYRSRKDCTKCNSSLVPDLCKFLNQLWSICLI